MIYIANKQSEAEEEVFPSFLPKAALKVLNSSTIHEHVYKAQLKTCSQQEGGKKSSGKLIIVRRELLSWLAAVERIE